MPTQQIEYVAIVRDDASGTTTREYFRAGHYLEAKGRYAGVKDVEIVGVFPISTVKSGEVVTILNPDDTIGEIGHVVGTTPDRDNDPRVRCFFE